MLSPDRYSNYISENQTRNIIGAAAFAMWSDHPLTRFITVNWELAGVPHRVQGASTIFLSRARDWLHLKNVPFAAIYVFENPPGGCLHQHIVLHLPSDIGGQFSRHQLRWLRQAGAQSLHSPYIIKTTAVGYPRRYREPGHYLKSLAGLLRYLLKGANPRTCSGLGIRHVPQGVVYGKRCGVSESLGLKRRMSANQPW